jgi:phosphomannomutase
VNSIMNIFKAYDVRGKVGTELTKDVANRIGKALAAWLPNQGTIAVGRDMRPDSAELAGALIEGLRVMGRDVIDIGLVTSDMIYFAVARNNLAGGAMVTASHNPGADNGIKLCREEARPIGETSGLFEIRDMVIKNDFTPAKTTGSIEEQDITEDWVQHMLSFIEPDKLKPLHIAVDAGNGMAGKIFPELEPYVPFVVEEMYFKLDGTFPNHLANPTVFETLTDIISKIKTMKLDGGIAFDGDGDRAYLIDETGTVISGSALTAMLGEYFLQQHPGSKIVYDARTSKTVVDVAKRHGGEAIRSRVGHAFIKQKMREVDAPFGGEASGHFYFRDNWYADSGMIAAIVGLYVASQSGKKLSELREFYSHYATLVETNFTVEDKQGVMKKISAAFANDKQDWLDGLTIDFGNDSWINVRPSNTEPLLRLNAEAPSQNELDQLVAKVTKLLPNNE